jgi:hypothetical protein
MSYEMTVADWTVSAANGKPVNIKGVCEAAGWHLGTAIEILKADFSSVDSEAFANFVFNERAGRSSDLKSEDLVNDDQWNRLSIPRS